MPLAAADRTRLAHVLALLGSPHQGERDAAALAADRLVRGRGLAWTDVLAPETSTSGKPRPEASRNHDPSPPDYDSNLRACRLRPDLLTAWERDFIASLPQQRRVSLRQRDKLAQIAAHVRAVGPGRG